MGGRNPGQSANRGEAEEAAAAASCRLSLEGCSAMTPAKKELMESNWPEQQQLRELSQISPASTRLKESNWYEQQRLREFSEISPASAGVKESNLHQQQQLLALSDTSPANIGLKESNWHEQQLRELSEVSLTSTRLKEKNSIV